MALGFVMCSSLHELSCPGSPAIAQLGEAENSKRAGFGRDSGYRDRCCARSRSNSSCAPRREATKDISLLPTVGRLRYLELWLIRGFSDISAVGRLDELRSLVLQALKNVESLPDLSGAGALRRVHLETMKGLRVPAIARNGARARGSPTRRDAAPATAGPEAPCRPAAAESRHGRARQPPQERPARELLGLPEVTGPFDWRAG